VKEVRKNKGHSRNRDAALDCIATSRAQAKAHLNLPRRIKGRPLKAFAAKTVFSASIAAGFLSPSAIWIPPPAAMEQPDVLLL
jgi:hypothetical protein